jgi:hypothetical protein
MRNYHELTSTEKTSVKPIVQEIRKQLYGTPPNSLSLLKEGLVINFGKGTEVRYTVKVQVIA